jgi:hypothetical protein
VFESLRRRSDSEMWFITISHVDLFSLSAVAFAYSVSLSLKQSSALLHKRTSRDCLLPRTAPVVFKINPLHGLHGKQSLHCWDVLEPFPSNGRSGRVCDVTCGNVEVTWYSPTHSTVWRRRTCLPCWRLEAGCIHCCVTQQCVDMSQCEGYIVRNYI